MASMSTVHKIAKYKVQVLSKNQGETSQPCVTVRLYDEGNDIVGTAVFKDYGTNSVTELPQGNYDNQTAIAYFDIAFFEAFANTLRYEDEIYWKIAWRQLGAIKTCSDVSLDTKIEIIGDFFPQSD